MSFSPDKGAVLDGTSFTRQLSQRDLSLQIPINRVTVPGVVLTSACFADQLYEDGSAIGCLSNLLAVGFRRFEIDAYWDASRHVWSLCPVELGDIRPDQLSLPSLALRDTFEAPHEPAVASPHLLVRQDDSSTEILAPSLSTQSNSETLSSPSTTATLDSGATTAGDGTPEPTAVAGPGTAIDTGGYSCTTSATLQLLLQVLSSHLDSTQTNVNATVSYLILNLHQAASASGQTSNLTMDLPRGNNSLGSILLSPTTNISNYLYTPQDLNEQRADLNASFRWFSVNPTRETESAYFNVNRSGGNAVTLDGWPAESFVEMTQAKRLLVGVSHVQPELRQYNLTADGTLLFSSGDLGVPRSVEIDTDGQISNGCFFDADTLDVSNVNNSWAAVGLNSTTVSGLASNLAAANNLTHCGIAPILNRTLGGTTADEDWQPYKAFVQSTIWSWAPGEPRNSTDPDANDPSTSTGCAVLNAESGYWQVENCGANHHSACGIFGQPYRWTISDDSTTYQDAGISCDDGTTFDAPRTALENRYLLHTWRRAIDERDLDDETLLWVDFNDLDTKECWVIGQNATCPYLEDDHHGRFVAVPVVAAIIVFVLAALTVFVKCASNRQTVKRRRRRGDDGWDYEGVPS